MDRNTFFFRQKVKATELNTAFDNVAGAIEDFIRGFNFVGIAGGADVTQNAPANLTVVASGPALIYDQAQKHIEWFPNQTVNCALDELGVSTAVTTLGNERWLSIFAEFVEVLSDPRIDGNGQTVYFLHSEGFKLNVVRANEAVIGSNIKPALRANQILVADVRLVQGQTQILNADISSDRSQVIYDLTGTPASLRERSLQDVLQGMLDVLNGFDASSVTVPAISDSPLSLLTGSITAVFTQVLALINDFTALLARANTFTGTQSATGSAGLNGINGTGGTGNTIGVRGVGVGTGDGVQGVGGGTNGKGVHGIGVGTGEGVRGEGAAGQNAIGVHGFGKGTSDGVRGEGESGQNAIGVHGIGTGTGTGVEGVGGPSDGIGVHGTGSSSGPGVRGDGGSGNGIGVQGVGDSNADGVRGEGEAGSNGRGVRGLASGTAPGVHGVGGNNNGHGVLGEGDGNGAGVKGVGGNGTSGTDGSGVGVVGIGGNDNEGAFFQGGPGDANAILAKGTGDGVGIRTLGGPDDGGGALLVGQGSGYGVQGGGGVSGGDGVQGIALTTGIGVYGVNQGGTGPGMQAEHTTGAGCCLDLKTAGIAKLRGALHFRDSGRVTAPLEGDVWYNQAAKKLEFYDGIDIYQIDATSVGPP